jgi:hypothetical protein
MARIRRHRTGRSTVAGLPSVPRSLPLSTAQRWRPAGLPWRGRWRAWSAPRLPDGSHRHRRSMARAATRPAPPPPHRRLGRRRRPMEPRRAVQWRAWSTRGARGGSHRHRRSMARTGTWSAKLTRISRPQATIGAAPPPLHRRLARRSSPLEPRGVGQQS